MAISSAHLLDIARKLASTPGRRPRQADLRRAVSTIYYAVFHVTCKNCADCLVGKSNEGSPAWCQVYRSVEHAGARKHFTHAGMKGFPTAIQTFAAQFVQLQARRHEADYDPNSKLTKSDVLNFLSVAEVAIDNFGSKLSPDKKAFAVWTLLRKRAE